MPVLEYDNGAAGFFGISLLALYGVPAVAYVLRGILTFKPDDGGDKTKVGDEPIGVAGKRAQAGPQPRVQRRRRADGPRKGGEGGRPPVPRPARAAPRPHRPPAAHGT
jgi:hypothetical protein